MMENQFLSGLSAPARRALDQRGIRSVNDLTGITRTGLEQLHGFGASAMAAVERELLSWGFEFAAESDNPEIDGYILRFEGTVREKLAEIRKLLRSVLSRAAERMAYGMPTYTYGENLVHFAGLKGHIGFYPTPGGIDRFSSELASFRTSKGAVQFPLDRPLPSELIKSMALYRMAEVRKKLTGEVNESRP